MADLEVSQNAIDIDIENVIVINFEEIPKRFPIFILTQYGIFGCAALVAASFISAPSGYVVGYLFSALSFALFACSIQQRLSPRASLDGLIFSFNLFFPVLVIYRTTDLSFSQEPLPPPAGEILTTAMFSAQLFILFNVIIFLWPNQTRKSRHINMVSANMAIFPLEIILAALSAASIFNSPATWILPTQSVHCQKHQGIVFSSAVLFGGCRGLMGIAAVARQLSGRRRICQFWLNCELFLIAASLGALAFFAGWKNYGFYQKNLSRCVESPLVEVMTTWLWMDTLAILWLPAYFFPMEKLLNIIITHFWCCKTWLSTDSLLALSNGVPGILQTELAGTTCTECCRTIGTGQEILTLRCNHTLHVDCAVILLRSERARCTICGSPCLGR